jgi:predicted nucleic acid-binding Zn finger protein
MQTILTKDQLLDRFSTLSTNKQYLDRSIDAVLEGRVKSHVFMPSRRVLHTVVGRNGDEFVDLPKHFCTCQNYFFSVLGGREDTCYHLLAVSIAVETELVVQIDFHDQEFRYFLTLLSSDLLRREKRK